MTDNDIIKALEYCVNVKSCNECNKPNPRPCTVIETKDILDLINRQKAEIERLQKQNEFHRKTITENAQRALEVTVEEIKNAKSEAIKEFERKSEDRLIEIYEKYHKIANRPKDRTDMFYQGRAEAIWECIGINRNLVKEMTEGCENG